MLKVYGHPVSTCTRKVLMTLAETDTPHEFVLVDLMKGEHKQPEHLKRQPFGQIPVLDDDGLRLYESRAICRYLSSKAGDKLVPRDAKQRALMDQWQSVEQSNFSTAAMKLIFEHVFKRPQEAAALEQAGQMLETTYGVLAGPLGDKPFLAGDQLTLADIGYMPYLEYLELTPAKDTLQKFPKVAAWWKRLADRPTWKKVVGR
ncbi:MAG: glutathione S-transferase N-terminal domain-containing protein [Polyangiales bacterium]